MIQNFQRELIEIDSNGYIQTLENPDILSNVHCTFLSE